MKTPRPFTIVLSLTAIVALSVAAAQSAPPAKPAAKEAPPAPEPPAPQSVFIIPTTPGVARDPFYPNRVILAEAAKTPTNAAPRTTNLGCLVLKGLSGAASNPLAMINGRTMARGEDAEIVQPIVAGCSSIAWT